MAIQPKDFLEIAQQLRENDTEVGRRSSISRGYYALYHECKLLADNEMLDAPPNDVFGVHDALGKRLQHAHVNGRSHKQAMKLKSIGLRLLQVKSDRTTADYHLNDNIPIELVDTTLVTIEAIIESVEACRTDQAV